jgi:hypothetical protein
MNNGYSSGIYSDGTHLNDAGVELYRLLLASVLKVDYPRRFVGTGGGVKYRALSGVSAGGNVNFGFELAAAPTVRIFQNGAVMVNSTSKSGFTVSGAGGYEWEAYV